MKNVMLKIFVIITAAFVASFGALAEPGPAVSPEKIAELEAAGFETNPEVFQQLATGGQPMGRCKEGLTFDGIEPMPWLKSAANWTPGSEEVQPSEIRVTFMGSSPVPRPGQMGTSVYVELGNGKNFIFDMGPGAIANYLSAGIPFNQINDIFITHLHVGSRSFRALCLHVWRMGGKMA